MYQINTRTRIYIIILKSILIIFGVHLIYQIITVLITIHHLQCRLYALRIARNYQKNIHIYLSKDKAITTRFKLSQANIVEINLRLHILEANFVGKYDH